MCEDCWVKTTKPFTMLQNIFFDRLGIYILVDKKYHNYFFYKGIDFLFSIKKKKKSKLFKSK